MTQFGASIEKLFEPDEVLIRTVNPSWNREQLLNQEGVYYLKDVQPLLGVPSVRLTRAAVQLNQSANSIPGPPPSWQIMGLRNVWNRWMVRMLTFAPFYRRHFQPIFNEIPPNWDGNDLLRKTGLFRLSQVSRLIPFSSFQLRNQARRYRNSRLSIGIWRDETTGYWLVDMEPFSSWITKMWRLGFQEPDASTIRDPKSH